MTRNWNWNWKHFSAAGLIIGAALVKNGAPLFTVILGVSAVAVFGFLKLRRAG